MSKSKSVPVPAVAAPVSAGMSELLKAVAAPVSAGMSELLKSIGGNAAVPAPAHHKSAKQFIRETLVDGAAYTLDELCALGGHTPVTIRTMLSDLRSVKYAGKAGVFMTVSVKHADGKTYYSAQPTIVS